MILSLVFFPEVSAEINSPTFSGRFVDQTESILVILFLFILPGLLSSYIFIMIPFTIIISIVSIAFFRQKKGFH